MIRIGIIGVGRIGRARHIPELEQVENTKIVAICDVNPAALKEIGDQLGLDEAHCFTDYEELIRCPEVDAVEICTPNYLHVPMALRVCKAGKPVNVEKPLAISKAQAAELAAELEKNRVPNMMCFTYRFMPAVRYAKSLLDQGVLGQVVNVDVAYLQSGAFIEGRRLEWRFRKDLAGSGALADLGVHLLDMTRLLIGEVRAVNSAMGTVVKQRKRLDSEELADVTVDDFCSFIAELENGVIGNFTMSRCAIGHSNTIKYDIYGTDGVISFNLNDPSIIYLCLKKKQKTLRLRKVKVPEEFYITQEQAFIEMLGGKEIPYMPTIEDGVKCQAILDAVQKSAQQHCRVEVEH